jgi:hypothetical protein
MCESDITANQQPAFGANLCRLIFKMNNTQERIDDALLELVIRHLPDIPHEDETGTETLHDNAFERMQDIIDRCGAPVLLWLVLEFQELADKYFIAIHDQTW